MKRFILYLSLLVTIVCCYAQTSDETRQDRQFYKLYLGMDIGYPPTIGGRITFMARNDLGISLGVKRTSLPGPRLPVSFKKDAYGFKPGNVLLAYSLCFVKNFPSMRLRSLPGIEVGLAVVDHAEAKFDQKSFGSIGEGLLSLHPSNLYINYSHRYSLGFSYRIKINIPCKNRCNLELSLTGNLNDCQPYTGIELSWQLGCFKRNK